MFPSHQSHAPIHTILSSDSENTAHKRSNHRLQLKSLTLRLISTVKLNSRPHISMADSHKTRPEVQCRYQTRCRLHLTVQHSFNHPKDKISTLQIFTLKCLSDHKKRAQGF